MSMLSIGLHGCGIVETRFHDDDDGDDDDDDGDVDDDDDIGIYLIHYFVISKRSIARRDDASGDVIPWCFFKYFHRI